MFEEMSTEGLGTNRWGICEGLIARCALKGGFSTEGRDSLNR